MSVFFLVQPDEKGQIGKATQLSGLGNIEFSALQLASCVGQAKIVSVINGRQPGVFLEQPPEIHFAHIAQLCVISNGAGFVPMLGDLRKCCLEAFEFGRDLGIAFIDLPKQVIKAGKIVKGVAGGSVFRRPEECLDKFACLRKVDFYGSGQIVGKYTAGQIELYDFDFGVLLQIDAGIHRIFGDEDQLTRTYAKISPVFFLENIPHLPTDSIDKSMLQSAVSEGVLVVFGPGYILDVDILHPELGFF